jgi:tight adherence protein B
MQIIWASGVFVLVIGIVLFVDMFVSRARMNARLRQLSGIHPVPQPIPASAGTDRVDSMPTVTKWLSGRHLTEALYTELAAAGLPIRPSEFLGIVAGSVILFQVIGLLFARSILSIVVLGVVSIAIPFMVIKYLQHRRRAEFGRQIVDALMLLVSSLRSGFSMLKGMQMIAQEMPPPISQEFGRAVSEVNVGRSLEDALRSIVARTKNYDFDLVTTAVLIQLQVGGNLADILETIAETIRERIRINGEVNALTAEGRISGVVLVLLPIGLGTALTFINPGYMSVLLHETIGHYLIAGAVMLQVLGALIIKKMLDLDF